MYQCKKEWSGFQDAVYLKAIPFLGGNVFNHWLELRQAQEVHVAILLLVMLLVALGEIKSMEGIVVGGLPFDGRIFSSSEIL